MNTKSLLALLLTLALALSLAPAALAEDEAITHDVTVVSDNNGQRTNLTSTELARDDVSVTNEGNSIEATVPGVELTRQSGSGNGANAALANGKTANSYTGLAVEGEVTLTLNDNLDGVAVRANAVQGTAEVSAEGVTVTGSGSDSTSQGKGVYATAKNGGSANVSIGEGGVSVTDVNKAQGIAMTADNASVNVTVAGNVDVSTNNLADKIAYGAKITYGSAGSASLEIDGDVTATGSVRAAGLWIVGVSGSEAAMHVTGDVASEGHGLVFEGAADAANTVIVEGTLSGDTDAIYLKTNSGEYYAPENTDVYVWKIENPMAVPQEEPAAGSEEAALEDLYENSVHYIIRKDVPEGATLVLNGIEEFLPQSGDALEYANENDVVTLDVDLTFKYKLAGAYNDGAALEKDDDGNYFLVIPRGGGVYLTIDLQQVTTVIHLKTADGTDVFIQLYAPNRCRVTVGDYTEFCRLDKKNAQIVFTNYDGLDNIVEEADGEYKLTYRTLDGTEMELALTETQVKIIRSW